MVNHLIKTKVTSITRPNRFNKWIVGGLENPYPLLYRAGLKNFPGGKILGTFSIFNVFEATYRHFLLHRMHLQLQYKTA